jgi:membrane protease YdiL (CAAX protease family)
LIVFSPAIFALKIALPAKQLIRILPIAPDLNEFLQVVAQWPIKAAPVVLLTAWLWKNTGNKPPVAGLASLKADRVKPYLIMLLLMLPLVILAATLPDFQMAYPKLYLINTASTLPFWKGLVFELSYGLDFFTIEFFFRGFLILAFARFAGKAAILPMAVFYCTIHFGKPLGECISSFFGGIILGAVVYNTRSIWGGLIVHLGIAWAMELAGVLI